MFIKLFSNILILTKVNITQLPPKGMKNKKTTDSDGITAELSRGHIKMS
jgi:hypothetical protein